MRERFAFNENFEPVVNVGENVQFLGVKEKLTGAKYARVLYIESLPLLIHDFGAIAAGVPTDQIQFEELYLSDNEFGQFRFVPVVDDVIISNLAQPRANPRWITKNAAWTGLYEIADPMNNPMMEKYHLNEIFQHEDDGLWVRLTSVGGVAVSTVACYGFRYVYETLTEKPTVFTPVPVRGFRTVIKE